MSINDIFYRLLGFGKSLPSCRKLQRSSAQITAFKEWVQGQVYLNWTGPFFKAYHYQKAHLPSPLRVQLVAEEHRQGIIMFYSPSIGYTNFKFLFDFLKERVLTQGYTLRSSDVQNVRHARYFEEIERHFLIPPASDVPGTELCNQLYGNINIELVQINKRPGYIRFTANSYADLYFSKPLPFSDLLEQVLQPHEQQKPGLGTAEK